MNGGETHENPGIFLFGDGFLLTGNVWAQPPYQSYNRPFPLMDYVPQEVHPTYRYDSGYWTLEEVDCRLCHGASTAERHHYTQWALDGDCLHCHEQVPNPPEVNPERNCIAPGCHGWPDDIGAPPDGNGWHHNTEESASGNCVVCHGAVDQPLGPGVALDDTVDLDVLPRVFNCENCHWEQAISNQSGDPDNPGHPSTYDHYDQWGNFTGFYEYPRPILSHLTTLHMGNEGNVVPQCYMCHSLTGTAWEPDPGCDWDPYNPEQIRFCQRCHTQQRLHEIHVPGSPDWELKGWEAVGFHVPLRNNNEADLDPDTYRSFTQEEACVACHSPTRVVIEKIVLKDLDNDVVTRDFTPGTNIKYKVKFSVAGIPNKQYKVVVTGKAFSLYKPDETNREWIDKFDNPKRKRRKLYGGESKSVWWDRRIPNYATPGTEARVKFTLKLKEYDEATGTWNLLGTYYKKKKFNIVP